MTLNDKVKMFYALINSSKKKKKFLSFITSQTLHSICCRNNFDSYYTILTNFVHLDLSSFFNSLFPVYKPPSYP